MIDVEEAKTAYVRSLLAPEGPAKHLAPHEVRVLAQLKAAGDEVTKAEQRLASLRAEVERAEVAVISARGRASALADLLWLEHLELRGTKVDAVPTKPNGEVALTG